MHLASEGVPGVWSARPRAVTQDVACVRTAIANVYLVGEPAAGDRGWVLVDAGVDGSAGLIAEAASRRFGQGQRPAAIVLTHGHFDHVGALPELAERWEAPVYAHAFEMPYLTGRSAYPPPDPTVGGGAMAALSWLYPQGPFDLTPHVRELPGDGSLPAMPGWRWIHTPGHSPGHVSLFREGDRLLLSGDAVITTRQESALSALTQKPEIHGPPAYFTPDWYAAWESVGALAALRPEILASGHGAPLRGEDLTSALEILAREFPERAVPRQGRYVREPAVADATGVRHVPPGSRIPGSQVVLGAGALVLAGLLLMGRGTRPPVGGGSAE